MAAMRKTVPARDPHGAYRRTLLEKRSEVLASLGVKFDTAARMGRVAEDDQAQMSHDEFISLRLNGLDYSRLRLVDEALDRIRSGDYGQCLACERPIPAKRLAAIPWARFCVPCQEAAGSETDPESQMRPELAAALRD